MKILPLCFCLLLSTLAWGQTETPFPELSFSFQNGISNHYIFDIENYQDKDDLAFVNAFRVSLAFKHTKSYNSIVGLQLGTTGVTKNWVCDDWDYCDNFGASPIDVKDVRRRNYLSLIYNGRWNISSGIYAQGGLSVDSPFRGSFRSKYKSSDGQKTKDKDSEIYGKKILINSFFSSNILLGKEFSINEKYNWFLEFEYKMYNVFTKRFEDYEDYFLSKNEKPWTLGINLGFTFL